MPLTRKALFLSVIVCLCAGLAAPTAAKKKPTLVEVWCVGDDALTVRVRDILEGAFRASRDFRLSYGGKPGTLLVTIPSNVEWRDIGKRTRVLYSVSFTSVDGRSLGNRHGSCWEDRLSVCATQIIDDARGAARRMREGKRESDKTGKREKASG